MLLLLPPAKTPERGATGLGARPPVHFEWFARRVASARPDELQKCKRSCLSRKQGGRCQLLKYEQLKNEPPEQSRLGKSSTYSDQYDASQRFPIPRAAKRAEIGLGDKPPFLGADLWTSHELSWLNLRGKPQVALAHFTVPCETPSIAGCGEITPRGRTSKLCRDPDDDAAERCQGGVCKGLPRPCGTVPCHD